MLLIQSVTSLKQLFAMTMDVHSRFRTEAHQDVVGRFNERYDFLKHSNHCFISLTLTMFLIQVYSVAGLVSQLHRNG